MNILRGNSAAMPRPACAPISEDGLDVRILCAGTDAAAGGIGRVVANLIAETRRLDPSMRISVIDTRGSGHIALSPIFCARALAEIAMLRFSGRRPTIHANLAGGGSAARKYLVVLLARALGFPVILHLHGGKFDTFYGKLPVFLQKRMRATFRRADRVVVLGSKWRRFVTETVGLPETRVAVVPNGVPMPDRIDKETHPASEAHIVFLGRLGPNKGVPELIAALGSAELRQIAWRATLAGDADSTHYKAEAVRLGIAERVHFSGWLGNDCKNRLLRSATMLVLPSHAEGLPLAVIEALAQGVPVITTPVGAIPDFLKDGESALIVRPGDSAGLAQAITRLARSAELRSRLEVKGREIFARNFDISAVAGRFIRLYSEVARGAPEGVGGTFPSMRS